MSELELWGGHECTVNRVGDRFFDQTILSGHQDRPEDLERFANLGLTTLRYPVLWERVAPDRPDACDWSWSDDRLERMERLGLRPIVGLVHHGSGPRYTGLMEQNFSTGLAHFAGQVARRYPHVRDWTPVNEPLTTARFSALYGHWYPHLRDETAFWLALLNQIDATRLAMKAIRKINPQARLIQTEDLGRAYATKPVQGQADFDNQRRWATWDLLAGKLTRAHPLWDRLVALGFRDRLAAIHDDPCPADILGINHYLTSDRFLDNRVSEYPVERHGANGEIAFADVEAIRVLTPAPAGLHGALTEAWARYRTPLVVSECHLNCTREDQIRWVRDAWDIASRLRLEGVEIQAVTAWALLGSFDWDSLLTQDAGHYECGAYDVRAGIPRPTGLARTLRALSKAELTPLPGMDGQGWWRRDIRLTYRPVIQSARSHEPQSQWKCGPSQGSPLLITGAKTMLGTALARACEWRGLAYVLTNGDVGVGDLQARLGSSLQSFKPWAVLNATGSDADGEGPGAAADHSLHIESATYWAKACKSANIPLANFSSDLVFGGVKKNPYTEEDLPCPSTDFGRSRLEAELQIAAIGGESLILRAPPIFSPFNPSDFPGKILESLRSGRPFEAPLDLVSSRAYAPDLINAVLDLLIDGERGIWHLANPGVLSAAAFACMIANAFGHDVSAISARSWRELGLHPNRRRPCGLSSVRGRLMPSLTSAVDRYAVALAADGALPVRETIRPAPLEKVFQSHPPGAAGRPRLKRTSAAYAAPHLDAASE